MLDPTARDVLVCLRYGIGDVVMETPVLRALRRALPAARLTALGAFPATQLLQGTGMVDELSDLASWSFRHRWDRGTEEGRRRFRDWFTRRRFDLVLDAHHAPPAVAETIWGMGIRSLESREEIEAEVVARGGSGVSAILAATAAGWGMELDPRAVPWIVPTAEHIARAEEFLAAAGIDDATPVAISPAASHELKRWPLERAATFLDAAMGSHPGPLLILSGPQRSAGAALRSAVREPHRVHLVGAEHLLTVAALLARCRALVSNDTGLMHLAAAVGTPTVGIFGPTSPAIYRPPVDHAAAVTPDDVPCLHRSTGSLHPPRCLKEQTCLQGIGGCVGSIGADAVTRSLQALLRRTAPMDQTRHWLLRSRCSRAPSGTPSDPQGIGPAAMLTGAPSP